MNAGEIEGTAERLYREAGFDLGKQAPSVLLARRLVGDRSVYSVPPEAFSGRGALVRVGAERRIYVRADLPMATKRFVLLHEVAHWALGPAASEVECDALAASLLLPRDAFLRALERRGSKIASIARIFGTDHSCVWLRIGETTARPLVLLTPGAIRVRGAAFSWPSDKSLREMAARQKFPGLRKTRLSDDPQRIALAATPSLNAAS
jgi:hypothetical protein